jgi:hypothetical protein
MKKIVEMIPKIVDLERKLGKMEPEERDAALDKMISKLKQNSDLGTLWADAE